MTDQFNKVEKESLKNDMSKKEFEKEYSISNAEK